MGQTSLDNKSGEKKKKKEGEEDIRFLYGFERTSIKGEEEATKTRREVKKVIHRQSAQFTDGREEK